MMRTILLLTPVYICVFWAIILFFGTQSFEKPKRFLAVFMLAAFVVYFSHFLYFKHNVDLYYIIDPFYQLASLIVYPLCYIYFRILTIEPRFSFKWHWRYLFLSVVLFVLYLIAYVFTDKSLVIPWLFTGEVNSDNFFIHALSFIRTAIKIYFIIQLVYFIFGNVTLILNYSHYAEHYYSDFDDTGDRRVKMLNFMFSLAAIASIIIASIGKVKFQNSDFGLACASFVFSTIIFLTGLWGYRQKILNPNYEEYTPSDAASEISIQSQQVILEKLVMLFAEQKIYRNSKLNINDVANEIGTNRTYLSTVINNRFDSNFCTFVNEFRMQEMEKAARENPKWTNQMLCDHCGFGSVNSMRRYVQLKSGLSTNDWRKQLLTRKAE